MFLFPETYRLRDRLAERYPHLRFERRGTTLTPEQQEAHHGPELWRRNPDACCRLRKVDPMREVLAEAEVWMTGIMRSQSRRPGPDGRGRVEPQITSVLKVNPLATWDRPRVWEYVQANASALQRASRARLSRRSAAPTAPGGGRRDRPPPTAARAAGPAPTKTECGLHLVTREFVQLRREA